jgi:hypothetical protein
MALLGRIPADELPNVATFAQQWLESRTELERLQKRLAQLEAGSNELVADTLQVELRSDRYRKALEQIAQAPFGSSHEVDRGIAERALNSGVAS